MGDSQGVARPMDHSSAEPSSQTVPAETHGGGGGSTTATGCPFPNAAGTEQSQGKVGDTSALSHDAKASGCPVPHLSADSTAAATKAAGCPFPHTARKPDSRGAAAKAAGCPFPHPAGDAVPSVPPGFYADTSTGTHSHDATTAAAEPATTDRDGNRQNQQETLAAPEAGPSETTQQHAAGEVAEGHTGQREGVEVSASEAGSASQPAEEPLKCPLGFGAGNQAKLDPLNCMLCRALYFDAVRTQCGHVFCRACVEKGESCAICGADCRPLQSDDDMQGTVDKYVEVHSRDHKLTAGGNVAPQDQDVAEKHPQATRAAFFLQIGLRSLAGGNFHAAAARLEACHDALQSQASEEAAEGPEGLAVRLGAVCGSQGDCALRLDDGTGAARKYEEALRHLDSCASPSSEVSFPTSPNLCTSRNHSTHPCLVWSHTQSLAGVVAD